MIIIVIDTCKAFTKLNKRVNLFWEERFIAIYL